MLPVRRARLILAILALAIVWAVPARANLIGDTISIDHFFPNLAGNGLYEAHTTLVTAGTADETSVIGAYVVNPEANTISVRFTYGASAWSTTDFNGLVIGSIDEAVLSVLVDTNLVGWSASRLSFDAHTIYSNWAGLAFDNNSYFKLTLEQQPASPPVPEGGATLLLLGAAVVGLGRLRRVRAA